MHRIVHLDLKGAPWKVPYLEKVLLSAKQWGATGVLFEWEDTFPYCGGLIDIGSLGGSLGGLTSGSSGDGLYTVKEVWQILQFAKKIGLEAIQLVQTIGHMEFVLKHSKYKYLRESPRSPAVLCPSLRESQDLVNQMLQQVLHFQPDVKYVHIGADEVWHAGVCEACQRRAAASEHNTASLFLHHIREIVKEIKRKRPNLIVLMWDDMLRSISVEAMKEYNIGEFVQPVIWHYNEMECFQIDPVLWHRYKQVFPQVWTGSAFKGANGSNQIVSPVSRYVSNHQAWMKEFDKNSADINFAGIILTGWSRFDHYATLCELLPVSLPSLASCLRLLVKNDTETFEAVVSETLPQNEWPGYELARTIHVFCEHRDKCLAFINGNLVGTWLNPWQLEKDYTNPVQIEGIAINAQHLLKDLTSLQEQLSTHLHALTGRRSAEEWLHTLLTPVAKRLTEIRDIAASRANCEAGVKPILAHDCIDYETIDDQ